MPNIVLTEYCNLTCPYCFASKMITEAKKTDTKNITLEQFSKILNWLMPTALENNFVIGLIGGEPTLHPYFKDILKQTNIFCSFTNSHSILFTNGILLNKYLSYIGPNMSLLININDLKNEQKQMLLQNLDMMNKLNWYSTNKVTLGCNLYLNEKNYIYFWECVDRYNDISTVRVSVTAPTAKELKNNKEQYYLKMKPIFLDFVNEALKRNISLSYDCNQIPKCFFTNEEWEKIIEAGIPKTFCQPVIDITPDFKATCCFGVYNTPIDCAKFNNLNELTKYFESYMVQKTLNNNTSLCKNCEKLQLMQCQGGCLSFSNFG